MIKKIILISAILAASSNIANAGVPYVGGSLGLTNLNVHDGGRIRAGSIGKLFGGYGSTFGQENNIYLGGELDMDLAHYPYESGSTYGVGASFIPGILVSESTMIYGRIGVEADRNTKSSTTHTGNQLGLGMQTSLYENWAIRGEYVRLSNVSGNQSGNSQVNLGLLYIFE